MADIWLRYKGAFLGSKARHEPHLEATLDEAPTQTKIFQDAANPYLHSCLSRHLGGRPW